MLERINKGLMELEKKKEEDAVNDRYLRFILYNFIII
jgi:hypothetical protein